jgi:hypothetical protein
LAFPQGFIVDGGTITKTMAILTKTNKKFILLLGALSLFLFLGISAVAQAADRTGCPSTGLVPCGNYVCETNGVCNDSCPCQFCDFFKMITNIVNFIMIDIVPVLAILYIAYGGFNYVISAGEESKMKKAKDIFTTVGIGLIIIYGAWMVVGFALSMIGVASWTGLGTWYQIDCH